MADEKWSEDFVDALLGRIEATIDESGLRQKFIAERAGKHGTWVSDLRASWRGERSGRVPSIETLLRLARGLGITLGELVGDELLREPRRGGR